MKTAATSEVELMLRAVADRTRLRILNLLVRGELCVCDIVSTLGLPQPTVSRHLAYLRQANLVVARQEGQWHYYQLAAAQGAFHKKLIGFLGSCFRELPQLANDANRLERCRCC